MKSRVFRAPREAWLSPNSRVALFFCLAGTSLAATVLDKVYSAPQAERGAEAYQAHCAKCHEGAEPDAPTPKGQPFIDRWREAPLDFLFTHIRTKMPGDAPGTLSQSTYLDILAYLLRENGYPAGSADLTADQLGSILLTGPGWPASSASRLTRSRRGMPDAGRIF